MPVPLILPVLGVAALVAAAAGSKKKSSTSTTELSSPTDAQLQRASDVSNTGLAPWVGASGKNWQQASIDALSSKDPAKISEVAQNMRLDGLVSQAEEMDRYSGTLTAKAAVVNSAIAQTSAIITGKADADAYQASLVQKQTKAGVTVSTALNEAARQYATYIRSKKKGSESKSIVQGYQSRLGMKADGMFGSGDAVAMAAADIPPPAVWYWPKVMSQGPDALARVQAAIALAKSNPQTTAPQADWQTAYEAQSKSFSALYGVNARPRKATTEDVKVVATVTMSSELKDAMSTLANQSLADGTISGEIGFSFKSIAKGISHAASSVAKTTIRVANPVNTVKAAAKVVKAAPKVASAAVKNAAVAGKFAMQQASKVTKSPYVKLAAGGLAVICPPAGAAAVAAVTAINKGSEALSQAQQTAQAAAHMVTLAGKTVDALHNGTPAAKLAAKTLILNTHKVAATAGHPDRQGALAGLQSLAVAAATRSNAVTLAKATPAAPAISMAGILVTDSGKIVRGNYRAA